MSDPYIGEIRTFGFTFAPQGWAACEGQLMSISSNTALFSLLGTTYGGDGRTTFALPDLRGRVAIAPGQGPGLSSYSLGQAAGTETVTLTVSELPAHNHGVGAASSATDKSPANNVPAYTAGGASYGATADLSMSGAMTQPSGGSQPHPNVQPYLVIGWCIALEGIYPSRP